MKLTPGEVFTVIPLHIVHELLEYFEQREDADLVGERFVGNEEMHFAIELRELVK